MKVMYMSQKNLAARYDVSKRTIQRKVHDLRKLRPDAVQYVGTQTRIRVSTMDEYMLKKKPMPVAAEHEHEQKKV